MKKLDPVVKKETLHILCGVVAVGVVVQAVYLLLHRWTPAVLLGGVLGSVWATANFLLMGLTVQNTLGMDAAEARRRFGASYSLRTFGTCAVVVAAVLLPFLEWIPAVAAIFAPRLTIAVMGVFRKEYGAPVQNPLPVPEEEEDDGDELERILDKVYGGKVNYDDAVQKAADEAAKAHDAAVQTPGGVAQTQPADPARTAGAAALAQKEVEP